MKGSKYLFLAAGFLFTYYGFAGTFHYQDPAIEKDVAKIFQINCTTVGCHAGEYPAMGLNLEPDAFKRSMIEVNSQAQKEVKLIDINNPQNSYLVQKIRGDATISGKRMPLNAQPLSEDAIQTIQDWIQNLPKRDPSETASEPSANRNFYLKPMFWGTRLMNLVTPTTIGKKHVLFRISHRFYPSVQGGYDVFYGFNGPASIYLSWGYGMNNNMDLSVGHSNRFHEWILAYKWTFYRSQKESALPFSAAVNVAAGWVTEKLNEDSVFSSANLKLNLQLSFAFAPFRNLSFLLVPAYSSNVNHWEENSKGTFALGTGGRLHLGKEISILCEVIPVLAGYHSHVTGWGMGIEKKIGGHVFQLFALNSVGISSPQYLPGGDLCIREGDFRFGFNIFRWF